MSTQLPEGASTTGGKSWLEGIVGFGVDVVMIGLARPVGCCLAGNVVRPRANWNLCAGLGAGCRAEFASLEAL